MSESAVARIGPNAIIQVVAALDDMVGEDLRADILRAAGLPVSGCVSPNEMVDERDVIALHGEVRRALDADTARAVLREAGSRTGDYILVHRIPKPAQYLLRALPKVTAARLLLMAIERHSWTFAGSGQVSVCGGRRISLTIRDNPLTRDHRSETPDCIYYAATLQRLYARLVDRRAQVRETACSAAGSPACRFEIMPRGAGRTARRSAA